MTSEQLKSGTCPKCCSSEVYTDEYKSKHNDRAIMKISPGQAFYIHTYICLKCGYFEEYLSELELKDNKTISKIKEKWKKVKD